MTESKTNSRRPTKPKKNSEGNEIKNKKNLMLCEYSLLIPAESWENSLYRRTTIDYWRVWVNSIQPQSSVNCGWSTIICSTAEGFTEVVSHVQSAQELTSPITSASVRKDTWERGKNKTAYAWQLLSSHTGLFLCPCRDVVNILLPSQDARRPILWAPLSGIRMSIRLLRACNIITASLLWHDAGLTREGSSHERW